MSEAVAPGMASPRETFQVSLEHHRRGAFSEAIIGYRDVLRHDHSNAVVRNNLCLALLANGEYREGFSLYDVRFGRPVGRVPRPNLPIPEWTGTRPSGMRLLTCPEQGFGDQIMFARFYRALREAGASVSAVVPDELARLFRHLGLDVIGAQEPISTKAFDGWVLAGSVPGRLGLDHVMGAPYLPSRPDIRSVGLVTQGRPYPAGRSLPPRAASALQRITAARSLQPQDTGARDFEDTRAIIEGLELVITVDTAVAHLAGAMGKPTWLMLSRPADWRRGGDGETTPWYPSMRIFRQETPGDWEGLVRDVARAYEARQGARRGG